MSLKNEIRRGSLTPPSPTTSNRKELREALYSGIFQKYRKTIFVMSSFLQMLRKGDRNYGAIKSE